MRKTIGLFAFLGLGLVAVVTQAEGSGLVERIPRSALCYFNAVAQGDVKALVACFQPYAVVVDVSWLVILTSGQRRNTG